MNSGYSTANNCVSRAGCHLVPGDSQSYRDESAVFRYRMTLKNGISPYFSCHGCREKHGISLVIYVENTVGYLWFFCGFQWQESGDIECAAPIERRTGLRLCANARVHTTVTG